VVQDPSGIRSLAMVEHTGIPEPDGAGNSHRAGQWHEHQTAQHCGCSRERGCQWLCLTFALASEFAMPSIELICVGQLNPIDCSDLSFQVEAESRLLSHRGLTSSFQRDFDKLSGCIYHLLDDKGPTAYELLKRNWYDKEGNDLGTGENIQFLEQHEDSFQSLVRQLIDASPVSRLVFASNYQFSTNPFRRHRVKRISEFFHLYSEGKIRMNGLYPINKC